MKRLLSIIVLLFVIAQLNAQTTLSGNGGQYAENGSVKLQFGGLISGRLVWLKVWNKQNCTANMRVSNGSERVMNNITPNSYDTIQITVPIDYKIKAKTTTNCGGTDFGWVELVIPASALPVTFKDIKVTLIKKGIKQ